MRCLHNTLAQVDSKNLLVGDILKLEEDNEVPCDAVVLSTSDANGLCYIQVSFMSVLQVRAHVTLLPPCSHGRMR
jgi:phospholipid-translocating ATPase